jgi:predicted GNAT family N-acyltransferase
MITIKVIQASEAWDLRHRVMSPNRPFDSIKLPKDENGLHFGLFQEEKPTSVISFFVVDKTAQFRKFATEISEQGKGFGSILLKHIIEESIHQNVENLWCNARVSALGFYQKFGFEAVSETRTDNGIEYVKMERSL